MAHTFTLDGFQCELLGASYNCPRFKLYGYATPDQLQRKIRRLKCKVCNGTGANPLSDNANWLPCMECRGSGRKAGSK